MSFFPRPVSPSAAFRDLGAFMRQRSREQVIGAMLSISLSTPTAHHGVILFAMVLVLLLLVIESRRYRFFDVYRARVRKIERHYFAQIFAPQPDVAPNWLSVLGDSLRKPQFLVSHRVAFARRLRRNYLHMYFILLLAWVLKISTPSLQPEGVSIGFVRSLWEAVDNAALGPVPGWLVVAIIVVSFAGLLAAAFLTVDDEEELAHGSVHV